MQSISVSSLEPSLEQEDAWYEDQRLRMIDGEIVWTKGTCNVLRRFACNPVQPIFAKFESELCACALLGDIIRVNSEGGSEWDISLPCQGRRIWTNPYGGLFFERYTHVNHDLSPDDPVLFTISHPLEEAKPVTLTLNQEIAWVSDISPYMLTYSKSNSCHMLYEIKKSEIDSMMITEEEADIISNIHLNLLKRFDSSSWPTTRISRAFSAHTVTHEPFLCILFRDLKTLYGTSFEETTSKNVDFQLKNVLDCAPLCNGTEKNSVDMVVLHENMEMWLYRGGFRFCQILLPMQDLENSLQLVRMEGYTSQDECLDLVFQNKTRRRIAIRPRPFGTSEACEVILQAAREANPYFGLSLTVDVALRADMDDWSSLLSVTTQLITGMEKSNKSLHVEEEEKTPFELLLATDFHLEREHEKLFPTNIASPASSSQGASSNFAKLICSQVLENEKEILVEFFNHVHLTYEDLKLNVLQRDNLSLVGCFLAGLSRSLFIGDLLNSYEDYYLRDLGKAHFVPFEFGTISSIPSFSNVKYPPPSILDKLFELLTSNSPSSNTLDDSGWRWRSKKLFRVFTKSKESDESAVKEMIACGLERHQVETFPLAIQIVIREMLHRCRENPPHHMKREGYVLIGREDIYSSSGDDRAFQQPSQQQRSDEQLDDEDLVTLQNATTLRFGRDHRMKEVFKLLDSSVVPVLFCKRKPGMSDHDLIKAQQTKLRKLVAKSLAGTVGRGALMLFTKTKVYEKSIRIPQLAKSGRVPPQNVTIQLDEGHSLKYSWPSFHNGVASGLARAQKETSNHSTKDLTRTWILFNRPKPPTDSHAGVLLALGLNKDLACLTMVDTYEHIEHGHDLTSIAVLLGLGCAKAGTCDSNVRKTLTLHVPSLFPQEFSDLDVVSSSVQAAALVGLGLLYRGTCNRLMCEFFLEQIVKYPISDVTVDERESYSLAAGFGLGLVALGLGGVEGGLAGLADLEIEERLQLLIAGGPTTKFVHQTSGDDLMDGHDGVASKSLNDDRIPASDRDAKCSRVLEGSSVNTDVTSPGATMALAMIYLKSNEASVAARLAAPQTRFLLEAVRPDFLLYRVWAKSLVLWDSIRPDESWVIEQIPNFFQQLNITDIQDMKFFAQSKAYIVAGAALGMGTRFAGSTSSQARDCLLKLFEGSYFDQVDDFCSDVCLSSIALSIGLVMAGTGDLASLKILRAFRKLAKRYGAQQLSALSLGFLFLGAGKMSFSTSNEAIAVLICSIFPRLAATPEDNSSYLQAFRHLYVLAAESRSVETFDSSTLQPCYTPLIVRLKSDDLFSISENELSCAPPLGDLMSSSTFESTNKEIQLIAPALLPPFEVIESIRVASPRYWPLEIQLSQKGPLKLVVQLRADQLSYQIDPRGLSSLSARPRPRVAEDLFSSLRDFSKSPYVSAFAKYVPDFFETLYDCLVQDTLDSLPCILELYSFRIDKASPLEAEQVRLLKKFYSYSKNTNKKIVPEKLLFLDSKLDSKKLQQYFQSGSNQKSGGGLIDDSFLVSLNLAGIPKFARIRELKLDSIETNFQVASSVLDPDAFLEILDASVD